MNRRGLKFNIPLILVFLGACGLQSSNALAWWEDTFPNPPDLLIIDAARWDQNRVLAGGWPWNIGTTNGQDWQPIYTSNFRPRYITFIAQDDFWVSGWWVGHFTGEDWQWFQPPVDFFVYKVQPVSDTQFFAVGTLVIDNNPERGKIYFYDGESWREEFSTLARGVWDLEMLGNGDMIAAADRNGVLVYDSGHWRSLTPPRTPTVFHLEAVPNTPNNFFAADSSRVYAFDGNMLVSLKYDSPILRSLSAVDKNTVFVGGCAYDQEYGCLFETLSKYSQGKWTFELLGNLSEISNVTMISEDKGIAFEVNGHFLYKEEGFWHLPEGYIPQSSVSGILASDTGISALFLDSGAEYEWDGVRVHQTGNNPEDYLMQAGRLKDGTPIRIYSRELKIFLEGAWGNFPLSSDSELDYVAGFAGTDPNNIWIFGGKAPNPENTDQNPQIWHFDGNVIVPVLTSSLPGHFEGGYAASPDNVWTCQYNWGEEQSGIFYYWDGTDWYDFNAALGFNFIIHQISGVDQNHIWAAGASLDAQGYSDQGLILFFDGKQWRVQVKDPQYISFYSIVALDQNSVWSADFGGEILHFNGSTWSPFPRENTEPGDIVMSMDVLSDSDVWIGGETADFSSPDFSFQALASHWDGTEWTRWAEASYPWAGGAAWDDDNAWVVGSKGISAQFDGNQWNIIEQGAFTGNFSDVAYADANNVFAVAPGGNILRFDGTSWVASYIAPNYSIEAIEHVGPGEIWACGCLRNGPTCGGAVLMTWKNGVWDPFEPAPAVSRLTNLSTVSPESVWCSSESGKVWHWDGTEWRSWDTGLTVNLLGIHARTDVDVWVCGPKGKMAHFDGSSWTTLDTPIEERLNTIYALDEVSVWVGGNSGYIFFYNGEEFSLWGQWLSKKSNQGALFSPDGLKLWMASSDGAIRHCADCRHQQEPAQGYVLAAGYMDTTLTSAEGGTLSLLAVVSDPAEAADNEIELMVGGVPSGVYLQYVDGAAFQTFTFPATAVGPEAPRGLYLLGMDFRNGEGDSLAEWPHLTVE